MNLPSTEELQRLLNEATPGEWRMYDDTDLPKIYGVQTTAGEPICIDGTPQDCQIIQFTCDLAAEVIRLREGIETVAEISETRADNCHASHQLVAAAGHRATAHHLRSILEGDQA